VLYATGDVIINENYRNIPKTRLPETNPNHNPKSNLDPNSNSKP